MISFVDIPEDVTENTDIMDRGVCLNDGKSTLMGRRDDFMTTEGGDFEDLDIRIDEYSIELFERVRFLSGIKNEEVISSFNPEAN